MGLRNSMVSLSPQDAIELPVDELALQILKDMSANSGAVINEQNYCNSYVRDSQDGWSTNQVALETVSEAINWLHTHGLIAKDYTKEYIGESNAIIITRMGRDALKMTANDLRSIHRIEADLHALLQTKVR